MTISDDLILRLVGTGIHAGVTFFQTLFGEGGTFKGALAAAAMDVAGLLKAQAMDLVGIAKADGGFSTGPWIVDSGSVPLPAPADITWSDALRFRSANATRMAIDKDSGEAWVFGNFVVHNHEITLVGSNSVIRFPDDSVQSKAASAIPNMQVFNTNGTFVVPTGVTRIMVELWGGGGGGADYNAQFGVHGTGGGGGGYGKQLLNVIPGTSYQVTVGQGGPSSSNGGNSSFGGLVTATGGFAGHTYPDPDSNFGGEGGTSDATIAVTGDSLYLDDGLCHSCSGAGGASFSGGREARTLVTPQRGKQTGAGNIPGGGGVGGHPNFNNAAGFPGGRGRVIVYY